jgi:hypothetical protein
MPMNLGDEIIITGVARNCGRAFIRDYRRINHAFAFFPKRHWLVIESDSDGEVKLLKEIAKNDPLFRYQSLGRRESKWRLKAERLLRQSKPMFF